MAHLLWDVQGHGDMVAVGVGAPQSAAQRLGSEPGISLQIKKVLCTCLHQHLPAQSMCCPHKDRHHADLLLHGISSAFPPPPLCHVAGLPVSTALSVTCFQDEASLGVHWFLFYPLPSHHTTFAAFSKPGYMLLCCGSSPDVTRYTVQD